MKKFFLAGILALMAVSAAAQTRNHALWLPSSPAAWENVYFALSGNADIPAMFSGDKKLTSWGGGGSFEVGYDADGWLIGLRYTFSIYAKNNGDEYLMDSFMHNMISVELSRIFTKGNTLFLPEWLDLRVQIGAGCDIVSAEYYKTLNAKKNGRKTKTVQPGFVFNAGLFAEMPMKVATPFLGVECDFLPDADGMFFMPEVMLGARAAIGR